MKPEDPYQFRPVGQGDFALLRVWLESPHWARWWGEPEQELAEIQGHLAGDSVRPFIVSFRSAPLGYIQAYDMDREIDHPYHPQPPRTIGIDQSIGPVELIGQGHGPAMMRAFCAQLFLEGAARIITDPEIDNEQAIRAYQKAGFQIDKTVTSQYGTVHLMTLDAGNRTRTS